MGTFAPSRPPSSSALLGFLDRLGRPRRRAGGQPRPRGGRAAQPILATLLSLLLMMPTNGAWADTAAPAPAPATAGATPKAPPDDSTFNPEQLDAMLAPIALYPDDLLVQTLMAATYPLEIVEATRWLEKDNNKELKGDALAKALAPLSWDPSVKSLVPFPQVLAQLDQNLDWTQQIGYAMATQQEDVLDSVQRLRLQAQNAGHLKTTAQQVVSTQAVVDDQGQPTPDQTIVIQPADPKIVYVPAYNPSVVYGTWPYPAYPPVYYPPPPAYYPGAALASGMAFAAGVAVVGSLWGWAGASWGHGSCCGGGSINVNTTRYNTITGNNVNRGNFNGSSWRASSGGAGGRPTRPAGGPVRAPARVQGLPANAVGRPHVSVPSSAVDRPSIAKGARTAQNRPGGTQGAGSAARPNRAAAGNTAARAQATQNRPAGGQGGNRVGTANRAQPGAGAGGQRAQQRPATRTAPAPASNRGAFGGMNDGARAGQFQQRGSQSRALQSAGGPGQRGGGGRGGGARRR